VLRYLIFVDLDGSVIAARVLSVKRYPTHDEYRVKITSMAPRNKLPKKVLYGITKVIAVDLHKFIFAAARWGLNTEVYVVSGTLEPRRGYLYFIQGLPYPVFIARMSGEKQEIFYRRMYRMALSRLDEIEKRYQEDAMKMIEVLSRTHNRYSELLEAYSKFLDKSLGYIARAPEAVAAMENIIMAATAPSPAGGAPSPAPSSAPRRGILSRIAGFFRRLFGRGPT